MEVYMIKTQKLGLCKGNSTVTICNKTYLLSQQITVDPAFVFLSAASFVKPIGNMPPSSLRTTVKRLSMPWRVQSEVTMGVSI